MKLANKNALITGAGSGMGRAASILFAGEGAAVAAVDVNESAAAQTASEIIAIGGRAIGLKADVSKADEVAEMFRRTVQEFGRLNVVYNNAGIVEETTELEQIDDDVFDRVIAIDLRGVFLGMKYALPHLIAAGGGSIINTGSVAGLTSFRGAPAYTAAKAGVVALSKLAGLQWAKYKIRVNAICPGPIFTPLAQAIHKRMTGRELRVDSRMPLSASNRLGTAEEVARVALFLASDEASFVNTAAINIDGGF